MNKQDERRIATSSEEKLAMSSKKQEIIRNVLSEQNERIN
jgi:hypothetical protein